MWTSPRFRLGGIYAVEFDELRYEGSRLQEIVDHFLMKDEVSRLESLRRARLRARTKIEAELRLSRPACSTSWGVTLHYRHTNEAGISDNIYNIYNIHIYYIQYEASSCSSRAWTAWAPPTGVD